MNLTQNEQDLRNEILNSLRFFFPFKADLASYSLTVSKVVIKV